MDANQHPKTALTWPRETWRRTVEKERGALGFRLWSEVAVELCMWPGGVAQKILWPISTHGDKEISQVLYLPMDSPHFYDGKIHGYMPLEVINMHDFHSSNIEPTLLLLCHFIFEYSKHWQRCYPIGPISLALMFVNLLKFTSSKDPAYDMLSIMHLSA